MALLWGSCYPYGVSAGIVSVSVRLLFVLFARFTNHNSLYLKTHKHVHKKIEKSRTTTSKTLSN